MTPTTDAPMTVEPDWLNADTCIENMQIAYDDATEDEDETPVDTVVSAGDLGVLIGLAEYAVRHRLAALAFAPVCAASPDHADIMETIENAADDWQKRGYPTALAEVRDMANVGRSLLERIADHGNEGPLKGWHPADCPTEVVCDLLNMLADASAPTGDGARPVPQAWIDRAMQIETAADGLVSMVNDAIQRAKDGTGRLYAANIGQLDKWAEQVLEAINLPEPVFPAALARPRAAAGERRDEIAQIVARAYGGSLYPGLGVPGDYPTDDVDYRAADAICALHDGASA